MGGVGWCCRVQSATQASAACLLLMGACFDQPCVWLLPCPRTLPPLVPSLPPVPPPGCDLQPLAAQLEAVHVSSKAWANRVVEAVG